VRPLSCTFSPAEPLQQLMARWGLGHVIVDVGANINSHMWVPSSNSAQPRVAICTRGCISVAGVTAQRRKRSVPRDPHVRGTTPWRHAQGLGRDGHVPRLTGRAAHRGRGAGAAHARSPPEARAGHWRLPPALALLLAPAALLQAQGVAPSQIQAPCGELHDCRHTLTAMRLVP